MTRYARQSIEGIDTSCTLAQLTTRAYHGASVYVEDLRETLTYDGALKRWTAGQRSIYSSASPRFLFDDFKDANRTSQAPSSIWTLLKGNGSNITDAKVTAGSATGELVLTTVKTAGTLAADGIQVTGPSFAASGGAFTLETRVKTVLTGGTTGDKITAAQFFFGLTDTTALESPFTVSTNTLSATADDAVGFLYNDAMTTDTLRAVSVKATTLNATDLTAATTKLTGTGGSTLAPTSGVYMGLRLTVSAAGAVNFYTNIEDGTGWVLQATIAAAITAATAMYPTLLIFPTSTAATKVTTADYIWLK